MRSSLAILFTFALLPISGFAENPVQEDPPKKETPKKKAEPKIPRQTRRLRPMGAT